MEAPWILVICHEFPPIGGGAAKNLSQLCRELVDRGIGVRVLTSDPGAGNHLRHPFDVDYLPTGRRDRFETSLRGLAAFAWKAVLRSNLSRYRAAGPPALVLSCLGIPAGLAGTLASRRLGVPHAVWYHGSDVHGGRPGGCRSWQRLILRRVAASAAHNLFVSDGLRGMAEASGTVPGAAILPSCPSPEILAAAAAATTATTAAAPPTAAAASDIVTVTGLSAGPAAPSASVPYFLFLGRFEPVKNPLLAVEAMALIKSEGKTAPRLRLVGGGSLAEPLRARLCSLALAGQAVLEPPAAYDQVPALLRDAYALVVPSRVEGFNTTILEAARFGVPTVGADTVGVRDFVRPGDTGLLFPEGDAAALARALLTLAGDAALRDALGARARAAARPFTSERVADAFLAAVASSSPALASASRRTPSPSPASAEEASACP